MTAPVLEAVDVSYTYPGPTPTKALDGLSLEVKDHEFVALLGPVGCGKTTLLRIFAGFFQPAAGTVRCGGSPIGAPGWQRGYVLQEEAIFPWMTVRENVEFGLLAKGLDAPARRTIGDESCSRDESRAGRSTSSPTQRRFAPATGRSRRRRRICRSGTSRSPARSSAR